MSDELLARYDIQLINLVSETTRRAEFDKMLNVGKSLLRELDNYTNPVVGLDKVKESASANTSSIEKSKLVLEEIQQVIIRSGILDDPQALVHLSQALKAFSEGTDNHIQHSVRRNSEALRSLPMFESRKAVQKEYIAVRNWCQDMARVLKIPVKVVEILPPRTGDPSSVTSEGWIQAQFYSYQWTIDYQTFAPQTSWWVIADALGLSLLGAKTVLFGDFLDYVKAHFGLDLWGEHFTEETATFSSPSLGTVITVDRIVK